MGLIWFLTFLHDQSYVDFVVIEPAWDLHPTAVLPAVAPLSVQDGEGHISISHRAQQPVPGRLRGRHGSVRPGEDGAGAFGRGYLRPSPTEVQGAVSPGVIPAGKGDVVPIPAGDGEVV